MHACTLFLIKEFLLLAIGLRIAQGPLRTGITLRPWRLYQVFIQTACMSRIV